MLHTVNKSPFEKNSLDTCLQFAGQDSAILLIEDAVYGAMRGTGAEDKLKAALETHRVYALGPDLKARGMAADNVIKGIQVIDYDGFVDLAVEHHPIQSWL